MIYNEEIARTTAKSLLQIKAVKLNPTEPFTWASGIKSPIYCDNRITLSFHAIRTYIRQQFVHIIREEFGVVEYIGAVATGGIAQGALVAQEFGIPLVYVRSEKKSHGMENKIEGKIEPGKSIVVIEDLVSTGSSSLTAVQALTEAGFIVKGMVAIFSYNLEPARKNFTDAKCRLVTLSDYNTLINEALDSNYITDDDLQSLVKWRENPEKWGK
ncbi:MAG: orotate phosphoribosyltransferase [Bacteroidales bacterium]|jgi:orotate phosphoribosyltransferase|nr:orotate phosphoribosyltransferase [Bacteroidales bacterium]